MSVREGGLRRLRKKMDRTVSRSRENRQGAMLYKVKQVLTDKRAE